MGWTIAKLATLHRTIQPELLDQPNQLLTAEAADLGAADTTPDNLYMLGTFRLADGEALVIDLDPPDTRYWSVTLENIWHECIDHRRRRSSLTNAHAVPRGRRHRPRRDRRHRPRPPQLARHRPPPPRLRHPPLARQPRRAGGHHEGRTPRLRFSGGCDGLGAAVEVAPEVLEPGVGLDGDDGLVGRQVAVPQVAMTLTSGVPRPFRSYGLPSMVCSTSSVSVLHDDARVRKSTSSARACCPSAVSETTPSLASVPRRMISSSSPGRPPSAAAVRVLTGET